ncbi:hypothetical protein [Treponema sp. R6D11]
MAKPKDKNEKPAGLDLAELSDEALKQVATEYGVELEDGVDREGLIKAIEEHFTAAGDGGEKPPAPPAPPEPPKPAAGDGKGVVIKSAKRAGRTITAVTGKPITFDGEGKATVDPKDAEYLAGISGFEKA